MLVHDGVTYDSMWLYSVLPSSWAWKEGDRNVALDQLLEAFAEDLNLIADSSFSLKVYYVGSRGDWKFKGYVTGKHEYNADQCCDSCNVQQTKVPEFSYRLDQT